MKILATPSFSAKLVALDATTQAQIKGTLAALGRETPESLATKQRSVQLLDAESQVYVMRVGSDARLFYTLGDEGSDKKYLLALDLIPAGREAGGSVPSSKNPVFNASLNPKLNAAINPRLNSAINPRLNSAINPRLNSAINPRLNSAINPRLNSAFEGPFRYDLQLHRTGFFVRANPQIMLGFDISSDFQCIAVTASLNVYVLFSTNLEWSGYLVANGQGGFLEFNIDNKWVGVVI